MNQVPSLGERALSVALKEVGVKEIPAGSNTGPRIVEFLSPCVRGDRNVRLGLTASNWCMAFASWCTWQALMGEEVPPHGYRAGVVEAVADVRDPSAKFTGTWYPVQVVRKRSWLPLPGDLAIWDRSEKGKPDTSWWRHVNRVIRYQDDDMFDTVGGNERDQVRIAGHHVNESRLLGFIAYPQPLAKPRPKTLTVEERTKLTALVFRTIDGMIRDSHPHLAHRSGTDKD